VDVWARLASAAPGIVNLVTQTPGLSEIAKLAAGMPSQREIPAFAPQNFQQWFGKRRRSRGNGGSRRQVVLWPDTFTNHFHPDIAQAAVEVLENAGFEVNVPARPVCCGRPLYDFGMLDRAKAYLQNVIAVLRQHVLWGHPVIVLEPSCASVFRDEMVNLLPNNEQARNLSKQTFLLSEFLSKYAPHFTPPHLQPQPKALLHGHCHQKALMGAENELEWLKKVGIDAELLDSGCCGMAGSFGFEADKYDVSVKCGEHVLLPKVREASPETLIVASGFSCQEQIAQLTDRRALHLSHVLQMALKQDREAKKSREYPERRILRERDRAVKQSMIKAGAALAGTVAAGAGALWLSRTAHSKDKRAA